MNQKRIRRGICTVLTAMMCLFAVATLGTANMKADAASAKVAFVSSVKESVEENAKMAGVTKGTAISVTDVSKSANVYAKRNTDSALMGRLYRGSAAYVVKTKGSWSYITSGSLKGWVKSQYLVTGKAAKKLVKSMNPQVATVTASELNVRKEASTSSAILTSVPTDTQFVVLSVKNNWVKVRITNSVVGYIYKKYTNIENGLYTGVTKEMENSMKDLMKNQQEEDEVSSNNKTEDSGNWVSLGKFKITAYCACAKCNGSANAGKTASGATPSVGTTVAVDRSVISLGTKIKLGNSDNVYVAQDTGVKGNHIDVFHGSHSEALDFGVKYLEVFVCR
ncbi:MAG: SH3 domain-containing protein [Clostridiales bacterium]|nr:SH3 domain-containing protein [Clostridiales bacterium]